jgi:ceramide glucosyltransferase
MMIFLIGWSALAFFWWAIALLLLWRTRRAQSNDAPQALGRPSLTLFKPLPPVRDERERRLMGNAVESFINQLTANDQMLIGLNEEDRAAWQPVFDRWPAGAPGAEIKILARRVPTQCANPKIAWLQVMADDAKGELWMWSDADVTAPPGFIDDVCAQLLRGNDLAVSAPYRIQSLEGARSVLDALYVNVEFLPGALLLGQLNRKDFGYGAATVFSAQTFRERANWETLGAALADDHKLGELLRPVALGRTMVSTFTHPASWLAAWQHYYRWQKTVRWCQARGYAALLLLMPLWGWFLGAMLGDSPRATLAGLGAVVAGEILVALIACGLLRCRLPIRSWLGVVLWPLTRPVVWLLVWLPLPVLWSGRRREWFAPEEK